MTSANALAALPGSIAASIGELVRFVARSLSGITASDVKFALLFGLAITLARSGAAVMMLNPSAQITWQKQFVSSFVTAAVPALMVFLCLVVARNVVVRRVPTWIPFAVAALAAFALSYLAMYNVVSPILELFGDKSTWPGMTMQWVLGEWLNAPPTFLMCFLASFGYMYALDARRREDALRAVQLEGSRLARESYEARLQAMQARVEPQFLFDTLEHVEKAYERGTSNGERMLDDLITYLRGVLPSIDTPTTTVAIELEIARARLDIAKAIAGERFETFITVRGDAGAARMPPMVLLPLVEQATGSLARSRAGGSLVIEAAREGERLRIVISGPAHTFAGAPGAPPVVEVVKRLQALYGDNASLSFAVADMQTERALLELPYEREE